MQRLWRAGDEPGKGVRNTEMPERYKKQCLGTSRTPTMITFAIQTRLLHIEGHCQETCVRAFGCCAVEQCSWRLLRTVCASNIGCTAEGTFAKTQHQCSEHLS